MYLVHEAAGKNDSLATISARACIQPEDNAGLRTDVAVGGGIQRLAPAVGRQHAGNGGGGGGVLCQHEVHAPRQGRAAIPAQVLGSHMDPHHCRGACRVNAHLQWPKYALLFFSHGWMCSAQSSLQHVDLCMSSLSKKRTNLYIAREYLRSAC